MSVYEIWPFVAYDHTVGMVLVQECISDLYMFRIYICQNPAFQEELQFMVTFWVDQEFEVGVEIFVRLAYWTTVVKGRLSYHHPHTPERSSGVGIKVIDLQRIFKF
jgi:hypothetical protein